MVRLRLRALSKTLATVLATSLVAASAVATPPTGKVRSVRGSSVYVDLGRKDGVMAGDELKTPGGRLRVVFLGEKQLMADVLAGPIPRSGTPVQATREPTIAGASRPVVTLPTPTRPDPVPWLGEPARRLALIPAPTSTPRTITQRVRGDLRIGWVSVFDRGPGNLDLHRGELRSTLELPELATLGGGRLSYRHDLAGRLELGPGLSSRAGADSRPNYRLRELSLRWSSAGWGSGKNPESMALSAALGRLALWDAISTGVVDGMRADLALGEGLVAGLYGGVVPDLLDTAPSADSATVGAHLTWSGDGDSWRARANLTSAVAIWQGALSRVDLGATGSVSLGRDLSLYTSLIATSVDANLVAHAQPGFSLTRGYAGLRVRPAWWMSIDGSFAHDRLVADRELVARLGTDALVVDPRESAWLQLRFDPSASFGVALSGNLGFGNSAAEQQGGGVRMTLRDLGLVGLRATAGYRVTQTPVVQGQTADLDLNFDVSDAVMLDLGYAFSTFRARRLDERQDEHRISLGADILTRGPWRIHFRGFVAEGHLPGQYGLSSQLVWRFR
jgi:hypothetical protein